VYSEYNVPFNVTAPPNAIDAPKGSYFPLKNERGGP
jgi:hypothetical protein